MIKEMKDMLTYKQGLHDAWSIAQLVVLDKGYTTRELQEIFGDSYKNVASVFKLPIETVINKITKFTDVDFHIGDQVRLKKALNSKKFIVISSPINNIVQVIDKNFKTYTFPTEALIKTGHNCDIVKILEDMEEEDE